MYKTISAQCEWPEDAQSGSETQAKFRLEN